ncbi:MAG: glucose-1-phosphate adenylyltransferase [Elusimicrobiota bacterium]
MIQSLPTPTKRVLAIVLAGGKGERLHPLTRDRSKPAVPFAGKYRIVDFVLSNFANSGIQSIYVLVQYLSQSLIEHLRMSWRLAGLTREQFIAVVPPQMRMGANWYRGTADAVRQNLNLIRDFDADIVAVFGADHVYRMDVGQMLRYHADKGAHVTLATVPVPIAEASSFGIVESDSSGRVLSFLEKPIRPKPMPANPAMALSSMGNYLFDAEVLTNILSSPEFSDPELDFGKNVLPKIISKLNVYAYDFSTNILPGLKPYEEPAYWRDVGAISAYYHSNMDTLGENPRLDLNNHKWNIHSVRYDGPPAKLLDGELSNCVIGDGCVVKNARIKNSILGRAVEVNPGAIIEDSIIMDFCSVGANARIARAIVDRFNPIMEGETLNGGDDRSDPRYFRDPTGILVVPRGRDTRRQR